MQEKSTFLDTLTQSIYQQSSGEIISTMQQRILEVKRELEHLWHQQFLIEQEIETQTIYSVMRCA